jgi:divalent metal cation (Fe/Co/Zn/Cd) transporter
VTAADESDDERRTNGLPPAPSLPGETAPVIDPPKPVQASFWLWVTSGIVFIVGYAIIFFARQRIIDQLIKNNTNKAVNADQIRSGTTLLLAVLLVGAVCFAALYVLFAYKARQGTRSARTVLTVLMVITLLFQLFLQFASFITLIGTLIGLIALILMYLPQVRPYFPKVSRRN